MTHDLPTVAIVIPTYNREEVLIDTLNYVLDLDHCADELIVVDQTKEHQPLTQQSLEALSSDGRIAWLKITKASIPNAMNLGALHATSDIVLYIDDDIKPLSELVLEHAKSYADEHVHGVAGRVIQSWERALQDHEPSYQGNRSDDPDAFLFNSASRQEVRRFIGCNASFRRRSFLAAGGFDNNFAKVAYRFEAEFAERFVSAGYPMIFNPAASLSHLKNLEGGTRAYGDHQKTLSPAHSVGNYYYMLVVENQKNRWGRLATAPFKACLTRHHLRQPWWIPATLLAELRGLFWAIRLKLAGQKLLDASES